mgnify:CR=1 FL=1
MVKIIVPLDLKHNPIKKNKSFNSDLKYARDLKTFLEKATKKTIVDDGKKIRKEHYNFGYYMVSIERKKNFHDKILVDVRTESDFDWSPVLNRNPTLLTFGLYLQGENTLHGSVAVKHDRSIEIEPANGLSLEFTDDEKKQIEDYRARQKAEEEARQANLRRIQQQGGLGGLWSHGLTGLLGGEEIRR